MPAQVSIIRTTLRSNAIHALVRIQHWRALLLPWLRTSPSDVMSINFAGTRTIASGHPIRWHYMHWPPAQGSLLMEPCWDHCLEAGIIYAFIIVYHYSHLCLSPPQTKCAAVSNR
ncbi:hypothetical protein Nepgr_005497 [Nepenthes gracilis]|uniref:Uncharacterized protein n=1 Tax=Nepenthes gracilis TaxID=150966 RepID=A0AAD3XGI5_NEPGR|nr:hypothetical protein Nepgr_005497 [Nepenthes gracilis]